MLLCPCPGYLSCLERPPRATVGGCTAEDTMHDELSARQRAISLRLAGQPVKRICAALGRCEAWFHRWWRRYLEAGPEGLYDLTRASHHIARHISPELERAILTVRRRLQAHASPATRYCLIGAPAILAELKSLGVRPLPCERTIERVLERNNLTAPRVRLAPLLPRQEYPGPQARASNALHEVDLVGPIYLQGRSHRYYIWIGKDAFDGAVCLRLAESRRMDEVLWFLGECWKDLGIPEQVQFDNARELAGWGPAARTLSRVIRLCLRFGASPVFIPAGEPQFNGSVENFNGWFQEPLLDRRFRRPGEQRLLEPAVEVLDAAVELRLPFGDEHGAGAEAQAQADHPRQATCRRPPAGQLPGVVELHLLGDAQIFPALTEEPE